MGKHIITESAAFEPADDRSYPNDACGYEVGEYVYHVTPESNLGKIRKHGIRLKTGGTTHLRKTYALRLYLATSLIAAYDLSINFESQRGEPHVILKIDAQDIAQDYTEDESFAHGVYIESPIPARDIVEVIPCRQLFGVWEDEELEDLY